MTGERPGGGRDTVGIWFCPNEGLDEATSTLLARNWLDEHEREIAGRFLFERDRRQYLVAHSLVRRVLSLETGIPEADATIWRSSRGRPFLQSPPGGLPGGGRDLDFNLSHAHGFNVVAVARDRRVGIDIERIDRGGERGFEWIVESFAPEERSYLAAIAEGARRDRATLRLWTLKEAYAKAAVSAWGCPSTRSPSNWTRNRACWDSGRPRATARTAGASPNWRRARRCWCPSAWSAGRTAQRRGGSRSMTAFPGAAPRRARCRCPHRTASCARSRTPYP